MLILLQNNYLIPYIQIERLSNPSHLSNRALIFPFCFTSCENETRFSDGASSSSYLKNWTHIPPKLVLFSSIRIYVLTVLTLISFSPYLALSFSLSLSLGIYSPSFSSFILSQLLSHLQAFLSRSRIANSHSVSVSASPLFSVPARRVAQVRLLCTVHLMYAFL